MKRSEPQAPHELNGLELTPPPETIPDNMSFSADEPFDKVLASTEVKAFTYGKAWFTVHQSGRIYVNIDLPPALNRDGEPLAPEDFPEGDHFDFLLAEFLCVPIVVVEPNLFLIDRPDSGTAERLKDYLEQYWVYRKDRYRPPGEF